VKDSAGRSEAQVTHKHLQRHNKARFHAPSFPPEHILIDDLDDISESRLLGSFPLDLRQSRRDLHDPVLCPRKDLGVTIPEEAQAVEHEGAVASADFVDQEVLVWEVV
jgi:hypothetical protein